MGNFPRQYMISRKPKSMPPRAKATEYLEGDVLLGTRMIEPKNLDVRRERIIGPFPTTRRSVDGE